MVVSMSSINCQALIGCKFTCVGCRLSAQLLFFLLEGSALCVCWTWNRAISGSACHTTTARQLIWSDRPVLLCLSWTTVCQLLTYLLLLLLLQPIRAADGAAVADNVTRRVVWVSFVWLRLVCDALMNRALYGRTTLLESASAAADNREFHLLQWKQIEQSNNPINHVTNNSSAK